MLTAAEYTRARTAYQANLAAAVARMVGILNVPTDPEEEAPMKNTKTRYRVTRTITYLEVVHVQADSRIAAVRMVEAGITQPRLIRTGTTEYTAEERS